MKVGDIVTYSSPSITGNFIGLVTETGIWTGNCDVKVLWCGDSQAQTYKSAYLKVINEGR